MTNQQGIGLPEILVGLLLSSFMMLELIQLYLHVKHQYQHIQTAVEEQTDLQLAADLIRASVKEAGFTPCLSIEHLKTVDQRHLKTLTAIEINSDGISSIKMNRMNKKFDTVLQRINEQTLLITAYQTLYVDQTILISDCYHAEVQKIRNIIQMNKCQRVILSRPLAFTYQAPVYIGEWLEETYLIKPGSLSTGSLFYRLHHTEELTNRVHHLSARIERKQSQTIVKIVLGWGKKRELILETMRRNN